MASRQEKEQRKETEESDLRDVNRDKERESHEERGLESLAPSSRQCRVPRRPLSGRPTTSMAPEIRMWAIVMGVLRRQRSRLRGPWMRRPGR